MSQKRIDKAWQSMIQNLQKNTGKSMEEWISIIEAQPFTRTSEKVDFLKSEYGLGYGYAGLVIYHAKLAKTGAPDSPETLLEKQYKGKEHLMPIYNKLVEIIKSFGEDADLSPRNSYVSASRNTQFAMLVPASKTRFDLALKLKGQEPSGRLEALPKPGMCTHRITISSIEEIDQEVADWLLRAYQLAR